MAELSKSISQRDDYLLSLARERVQLPDMPMALQYQDDVDILCIRFGEPVDPGSIVESFEEGVIALYEGNSIVGVEILDITNQMDSNLNVLSRRLRDQELVR
jgi:hypothetical protein